ncbi:hypothetical protein PYK79_12530 [Streptomyces sp. ID05-04B]|nr:hypothetical protein [Streptomyces sp. ID05-04B]
MSLGGTAARAGVLAEHRATGRRPPHRTPVDVTGGAVEAATATVTPPRLGTRG